ncbi:helix-turn-helix transcriptional regulator [Serratia liquefaciens]|uniref:Helix-turn-helix transcriptional regulator n=2 Tax=Serratia liquefaciens TaxID=614 RepID=A0A515D4V4_SERLI|nr:helix-turn-helix transcriptional regulator [Serratia liquefaciens]
MLYPEGKPNKRNIGEQSARQIETALKLSWGWMDGLSDGEIDGLQGIVNSSYKIEVLDVQASAGPGVINSEVVQTIRSIEYTDEHASMMFGGKQASQVKMITVDGDSMAGTIELGDAIFVDVSKDYFSGDGIYVFLYKNHLHVKRLQMLPDHLLVHSDNSQYSDWVITEDNEHKLKVIGRVLLSQSQAFKRHG